MLVNDQRLGRHIPVYAWEIDNADAPTSVVVDPTQPNGSFHVSEDGFLFPFGRYAPPSPYDADQAAFQSQLVAEWTGFARTGTPTVPGAPRWTRYTPRSPLVMSLVPAGDSALTPASTMEMQHNCGFWDAVAPRPR
jgi:para-nitrobenzyl esterase